MRITKRPTRMPRSRSLGSDEVAFGFVTATVVVTDPDATAAEEKRKVMERAIQGRASSRSMRPSMRSRRGSPRFPATSTPTSVSRWCRR